MCSKWRFGCAVGNPASCGVMGNPSFGDDEFPQGESLPNLMAQGLLRLLPAIEIKRHFAVYICARSCGRIPEREGVGFGRQSFTRTRRRRERDRRGSSPAGHRKRTAPQRSRRRTARLSPKMRHRAKKQPKKYKKKRNLWAIKITIVTLFLSAFISYLTEITSVGGQHRGHRHFVEFIVLAGIIADGIGVDVTSCDITAHRVDGVQEGIRAPRPPCGW